MIWIKSDFERMMTRSTAFENSILAFVYVDVVRILYLCWFLNIKVTCWSLGCAFFILSSDCVLARITQSLKRMSNKATEKAKKGRYLNYTVLRNITVRSKVEGRPLGRRQLEAGWSALASKMMALDIYNKM